jgi:UDP-perosamine 4-acetyltransferase
VTRPVILLGAGGHAKVLIDALLSCGATITGLTDRQFVAGAQVLGIPVLGDDSILDTTSPEEVHLVNGVGSIGSTAFRQRLFERYKAYGFNFRQVVHPSAVIGRDCKLEEGVQVMAGAIIQAGTSIGANSIINTRVSVDHDCHIGSNVHIAPGVTISGGVTIGNGTHVGTGASIIQGINVGEGCLIAAGAVVVSDVSSCTTVMGIPARQRIT